MLNYFMARFTHYPNIFPFIGGVLDEGDPSTHKKKKKTNMEKDEREEKKVLLNQIV